MVLGLVLYILPTLLQSITLSRLCQERSGCSFEERRVERHAEAAVKLFSSLHERERKTDRKAERQSGERVKGGGNGFVQPVQGFRKQAQPTTTSPSLD